MSRRPTSVTGLLLHLLAQRPRASVAAAGAATLGALAAFVPQSGPAESSSVWLVPFYGEELVADARHVYWSEARDREYDDRPIGISRAAVRRRSHAGGPVETLFDFERDDTYCFPGALRLTGGEPAWHCRRPVFDGNGRADASRYVHLHHGEPREVPAPRASARAIAARGDDVVLLQPSSGRRTLVHLSATSGAITAGAALPFGVYGLHLAGLTADVVPWQANSDALAACHRRANQKCAASLKRSDAESCVEGASQGDRIPSARGLVVGRAVDEDGDLVWSAPRVGEGLVRVLFRSASPGAVQDVLTDESGIFVSYTDGERGGHLARLVGARVEELHRAPGAMRHLQREGDALYFTRAREIARLDLVSSRVEVVAHDVDVRGHSLAVGGGWVYWQAPDGLHRGPT